MPSDPADADALLQAGLERHQAGERAEAEALFRQALIAKPGEPTALYLLGLARFEAGDADEALGLFEQVVAARPGHVQARLTLANLHSWRDDHGAAAAGYRAVIALEPDNAAARVGLAGALQGAGDHAGAAEAAREALASAPGSAAANLTLGAALASLGEAWASAEAFQAAAILAPDTSVAHLGLALALLQGDDPASALASAERAAALDAQSAQAWFALGAARQANALFDLAIQAFSKAIELDPTHLAAHLNLGALLIELEEPEPAEQVLLRAVELDPASAATHANLSSLYYRADRPALAIQYARRALEIDPNLVVAHQNLAGLLAQEGLAAEARHHRDSAYRDNTLFITHAARPLQRVLVLTTTVSGNVPDRYLIPPQLYTRLNWFIEYAHPAQMTALPAYDVVFNAIGDQDLAGPTAENVARFLAICEAPVFNRPDRIERTCRHMVPELFAAIAGLVIPAVARLDATTIAARGLTLAANDAGVPTPLLARPIGSHGGKGLTLIEADVDAAEPPVPGLDHYVTAFHDFRSSDGLYRKYRVIFVDRRPYPYHLAISPDWMVHYETSGTAQHAERLAEEQRFLDDPQAALGKPAMEVLRAIAARMDLDFCGTDFTLLDDGRVMLFEANATMLVHPEDADGPLAHKNVYVERILAAFRAMLAGEPAAA